MRISTRFRPLLRKSEYATSDSRMIKSIFIKFRVRPNSLDPFTATLFAAREVVKLGLAKRAVATPWGIYAESVPANRLKDLRSHSKSMGASRWWIAN